jgi:hypothetical protein
VYAGGNVPANVPVEVEIAFGSIPKAVVVSAFVPVTGGKVSPGPWIVEVTPLADPSCTTS